MPGGIVSSGIMPTGIMPQGPRVSIVLPVFNGERYLADAVNSCLHQTEQDLELIVVDDGSSDRTKDIIVSLRDPRVKVIRHERNQGLVASLNHGFELARGRFFTWTSHDNLLSPEAIDVMVGMLAGSPGLDFVYAGYNFIDEHGNVTRPGKVLDPEFLDEDNCVGSCFLYRREVWECLGGYDPQAVLVEDYEYWLRVRKNFRMLRLNRTLYCHRHHPASLTMRHGADQIERRVHEVRKPYVSWSRYAFFEAGRLARHGDRSGSIRQVIYSLCLWPFRWAAWKHLLKQVLRCAE